MKAVTVSVLKKELKDHSHQELMEICLKLAKFKKENKELLTYLLFDSHDEDAYIQSVQEETDEAFSKLNHDSLYYVKKSTRKILRTLKKYIRYSKKKETEAAILLHFCAKLKELKPRHQKSIQMMNIYERQLAMAKKAIKTLHEDLQYDFTLDLEELGEEL
ncbi:hypothetical protein [uncultured Kordia sp.]|uniref:hypothetical protein n=1 Tax=uncultured Kordia sp. TaxID=507699 RepID=UPI002601E6EF|nr:hypothetical protein [uncultured Kordia sp.]